MLKFSGYEKKKEEREREREKKKKGGGGDNLEQLNLNKWTIQDDCVEKFAF